MPHKVAAWEDMLSLGSKAARLLDGWEKVVRANDGFATRACTHTLASLPTALPPSLLPSLPPTMPPSLPRSLPATIPASLPPSLPACLPPSLPPTRPGKCCLSQPQFSDALHRGFLARALPTLLAITGGVLVSFSSSTYWYA